VYGARISTQPGWEDIITDAHGTEFVDSYLATVAVSRQYAFGNVFLFAQGGLKGINGSEIQCTSF
jgi:hypothetical protein